MATLSERVSEPQAQVILLALNIVNTTVSTTSSCFFKDWVIYNTIQHVDTACDAIQFTDTFLCHVNNKGKTLKMQKGI